MKIIKTLAVYLAMLTIGAVAAGAASAHEWKVNGKPLTKPFTTFSWGKLEFQEENGLKWKCGVHEGLGSVGPGAAGEITKLEVESPCTVINGGIYKYTTVSMKPLGLPWKTTLVTAGGELRNEFAGGGWAVTASGGPYGKEEDLCVFSGTNAAAVNSYKEHEGYFVNLTFDEKSPAGKCADPFGPNAFHMKGTVVVSDLGGGKIEAV